MTNRRPGLLNPYIEQESDDMEWNTVPEMRGGMPPPSPGMIPQEQAMMNPYLLEQMDGQTAGDATSGMGTQEMPQEWMEFISLPQELQRALLDAAKQLMQGGGDPNAPVQMPPGGGEALPPPDMSQGPPDQTPGRMVIPR